MVFHNLQPRVHIQDQLIKVSIIAHRMVRKRGKKVTNLEHNTAMSFTQAFIASVT